MTIAVMKTKAEQALTEAFETTSAKLPGGAAVKEARRAAIGAFSASGLPHRRIEEWKYTDLRNMLKEAYAPAIETDAAGKTTVAELIVALGPLAHLDVHRIAFVNGHYCANLTDLEGADRHRSEASVGGFGVRTGHGCQGPDHLKRPGERCDGRAQHGLRQRRRGAAHRGRCETF